MGRRRRIIVGIFGPTVHCRNPACLHTCLSLGHFSSLHTNQTRWRVILLYCNINFILNEGAAVTLYPACCSSPIAPLSVPLLSPGVWQLLPGRCLWSDWLNWLLSPASLLSPDSRMRRSGVPPIRNLTSNTPGTERDGEGHCSTTNDLQLQQQPEKGFHHHKVLVQGPGWDKEATF